MLIRPITLDEFPKLEGEEVNLLIADTQLLAQLEIDLNKFLTATELKRYTSFYFQKDKDLYLLARYLLKTFLVNELQCDLSEIKLINTEFGKPCIELTYNLSFNLSHSGSLVALAVSRSVFQLGVDVEKHASEKLFMDIARDVFTTNEIAQLVQLDKNALIQRFYFLWTLKEAVIKADGKGLSLDLKSFEFAVENDRLLMNVLSNEQLSQYCWQLTQIELNLNYSLGLALRSDHMQQGSTLIKCYQLVSGNNDARFISAKQSFSSHKL